VWGSQPIMVQAFSLRSLMERYGTAQPDPCTCKAQQGGQPLPVHPSTLAASRQSWGKKGRRKEVHGQALGNLSGHIFHSASYWCFIFRLLLQKVIRTQQHNFLRHVLLPRALGTSRRSPRLNLPKVPHSLTPRQRSICMTKYTLKEDKLWQRFEIWIWGVALYPHEHVQIFLQDFHTWQA